MTRAMLCVKELAVNYGSVPGVHDVSLEVRRGEIVSLVGANGAGKTTTLSAIFGLVGGIVGGETTMNGTSLLGKPPEARVKMGLTLVPEGRHIFGTLTVQENLVLASRILERSERRLAITRAIDPFPILCKLKSTVAGNLSGGEQQQLAIARALVPSPHLLALDEPSLGLSPLITDVVFKALERLRDRGVTILLVEQNVARAADLADRTYVLRGGRVSTEVSREEIRDVTDFATHYLGA